MTGKLADWIWLDGEFVPWEDAKLHVRTEAVGRGANVFEGIRGYWNEEHQEMYLFKTRQHFKRLAESTRIMRMSPSLSSSEWLDTTVALVRKNNFRQDVYLRPTVYFGEGMDVFSYSPDRIATGVFNIATPTQCRLEMRAGINVCVSSWMRINDLAMPPRIKVGANYQNSRLAAVEAAMNGYDNAIFLNQSGKVSEATGACIFIVRDGVPITTPVTSDILESITRATLLQLLEDELGVKPVVRDIDRTELYLAEEAFLCGTAFEITPLASIDRFPLGDGGIGPLTQELRQVFHRVLRGTHPRYGEWRTPVYERR